MKNNMDIVQLNGYFVTYNKNEAFIRMSEGFWYIFKDDSYVLVKDTNKVEILESIFKKRLEG